LSSPKIKIRTSLDPNSDWKSREKKIPISTTLTVSFQVVLELLLLEFRNFIRFRPKFDFE